MRVADSAVAIVILSTIVAGLALDHAVPWGQALVSLWVWGLYVTLLLRSAPMERQKLLLCLGFATAGEMVLALLWGLYQYRQGNLPLFVPPGHALLFRLGLIVARRAPAWLPAAVVSAAGVWSALLGWQGHDQLSPLLWSAFALSMLIGRDRPLYAVMFLLALAMELYGTALHCWTWASAAPGLGLATPNPPATAGAFYCLLDLLVMASSRRWMRRGLSRRPAAIISQ